MTASVPLVSGTSCAVWFFKSTVAPRRASRSKPRMPSMRLPQVWPIGERSTAGKRRSCKRCWPITSSGRMTWRDLVSTVPFQEVTAIWRESPCANDLLLSMEVAAVSTRKRSLAPATVTWTSGRPSQLSRWTSSALSELMGARKIRRKKLRVKDCNMGPSGGVKTRERKQYATKTNVRAIIFFGFTVFSYAGPSSRQVEVSRPQRDTHAREYFARRRGPWVSGRAGGADHRAAGRRTEDEQERAVRAFWFEGRATTGHHCNGARDLCGTRCAAGADQ